MIRFPPRRILVPYDLTPASRTAWEHAAWLAKQCGSELEIVCVEPWQPAGVGLYPVPGLTPARTKIITSKIRRVVGDSPRIHVAEGDAAEWILRRARAGHADLIVMGTHGRVGLARFLLGSVAEAVVAASPVPVLVARGTSVEIRDIVSPVCFTSYSDYGFGFAARVAGLLGARLSALHVNTDPIWGGNPLIKMNQLLASHAAEAKGKFGALVIAQKDAAAGILKGAVKFDCIVLVAHKKSPIKDAVFGTTAERVLRRSVRSVLVVPPPRADKKLAPPAESKPGGVRLL